MLFTVRYTRDGIATHTDTLLIDAEATKRAASEKIDLSNLTAAMVAIAGAKRSDEPYSKIEKLNQNLEIEKSNILAQIQKITAENPIHFPARAREFILNNSGEADRINDLLRKGATIWVDYHVRTQ